MSSSTDNTTSGSNAPVQFIDEFFPLVVCVSPTRYDDVELQRMYDGYRRYFERGKRYALVTHTREGAEPASPRARKAIVDWANRPEVRANSAKLCVGSSTVVANALARGAMTAMLWLWKPASPHHLAATIDEAIDWSIDQLVAAGVALPQPREKLRAAVLAKLRRI
ncbi:hypothetical protein [Sandaracinus amylolyticus]|uniref:Uncharacterized protein n=1 Tax=Sandaracinus amylolyticus TaxID=927083 RepID=A0A0F6W7V6_9BACT|nr:hypothetical protein [Sandaracinus amylolyticus]AKF09731.1 hypothetical protein DB32_006880 [Sandaracinus amylolyticus]